MKRSAIPPEVALGGRDLESSGNKVSMMPTIQPYQAHGLGQDERKVHGRGSTDPETFKKVAAAVGGIWVLGVLLGFDYLWPVYLVLELLGGLLSIPPLSWLMSPFSWIFSWFNRGAPLISAQGGAQELRLQTEQVHAYTEQYVQHYGDAALIFATHDGYPQIVNGLLYNHDLGYADLIDATDESGNTALIYASAKGFRQSTAALLRSGADPDVANRGRTPLMEAAGAGHKDIVAALRLSKAKVDAVDEYGNTALHYAAYHGHLSCVTEILKSNPHKDLQNNYGHTPASYAQSNKYKAIADLLSRPPKREPLLKEKKKPKEEEEEEDEDLKELHDLMELGKSKRAEKPKAKPKQVKGSAEDLHQKEESFAPKVEKDTGGELSAKEKKSLEEQIAKMQRRHEDAELKNQKRIVELLEASAGHQQSLDEAERAVRGYQANLSELSLKVQELELKHRSSELRAAEQKDRAERLQLDMQDAELEVKRYQQRAQAAEKERDLHAEVAKRHEESLKHQREEVNEHLQQLEKQQQDVDVKTGWQKEVRFEHLRRIPDSKSGEDLRALVARRLVAKAGAQLVLLNGPEQLSKSQSLKDQGLCCGKTVSYSYVPTNLARALTRSRLASPPANSASSSQFDDAWDGLTELQGSLAEILVESDPV
ncbi:Kinase D-interacting substrate of 220 kDa B (Ankyrin repeat-rich membrane-spanning protein B) [Durusdinium trenchii]|uniref:Kinase D-interacting substrate of 220 kDa B (Ankyrin repeat-rich membrane-spanning protein B) n=1 Tax=Durusdinium trenchii TaxID=1381693 RepID=A0ABP0HJG7_9DINO